MKTLKLDNIKYGEISKVVSQLKKSEIIYTGSFEIIAKHFLKEFLSNDIFKLSYTEIVNLFLVNIDFENFKQEVEVEDVLKEFQLHSINEIEKAIATESSFYKYICLTYLDLEKEPKHELLKCYMDAVEDLKKIDNQLLEIETKLKEITSKNIPLEVFEKKPIFYYFQELNLKARDEILNFIKNEIKSFALNKCYDNKLFVNYLFDIPYNYRWNPKMYKPHVPNDLDNKFRELPVSAINNLKQLYKKDKTQFNLLLKEYISNEDLILKLNLLLDDNHILYQKKEIITEALNIYSNGAKIMFANAVPTIIEGIFHEICLLVGVKENELMAKGFQYKVDSLKNVFSYELYYEYYSFRFRIFRNTVAHGRLDVNGIEEIADLLLLDLVHVCKMVSNTRIKLNKKLFIINEICRNPTNYKLILEYIYYDNIIIPSFYNQDTNIGKIEAIINTTEFLDFIKNELETNNEQSKTGIFKILTILAKKKVHDTKRIRQLIILTGVDKDNFDVNTKYFEYYHE